MMRVIFKVKKIFIISAVLLTNLKTEAQDHIYSQFFNAPVYLNPALNGEFKGSFRMNMIYRNQWSSISGDLNYMSTSIDYQLPTIGGAVGLIFNSSSEGTAYLKKNNIAGIYSYSVGTEGFTASFGLQAGITNRKLDFSKLIFSDQLDPRLGFEGGASAAESPYNDNKYYFDAGSGVNFVVGSAMIGASMMHLNKPDESFTGSAGMQFKYRGVNAGAWFRSNGKGQSDSFVFSLIFDIFTNSYKNQKLRIGVSHDATTNKLNYSNTSGTSELSIGFETGEARDKGYNSLKCYDFY